MTRRRILLGGVAALVVAVVALVVLTAGDGDDRPPETRPEPLPLAMLDDYQKRRPIPDGFVPRVIEGTWRLDGIDDDQVVRMTVAGGGCMFFDHATAVFGDEMVEVTVWVEEWVPQEGFGCTTEFRPIGLHLRLPQPLGGRRVTGACDVDVPDDDLAVGCRVLASI